MKKQACKQYIDSLSLSQSLRLRDTLKLGLKQRVSKSVVLAQPLRARWPGGQWRKA
jgi:hypothetical protein